MSKIQLILLGQFECLLSSGERIRLSMRKAEVLLAYLALAPGLRHPRERLINLLWSDRSEEQARNSLRQCLSAIKKSLGDAADLVLVVDRTTVTLKPELIDVDVLEFERLAAESGFESLSTAASLYQGEFLEGISIRDAASQDWLEGERSRFRRQFIEVLTDLGQTQLASGNPGAAIKSGERLVEQDLLGEPGWRLLMNAYHDNGDRSHALQTFKRCQQALRSELDIEPEKATVELRDQIAGGQTRSAPRSVVATKITIEDSPVSTDHSIAVLPFDNLSGDPEQEYFSDGITQSIILNLSQFPGLHVKSRNSSFAFKQQIKSLGEISRELDVNYIVEGSIRKSAQRIRITVQLIEADSGNQIWGKRYDADLDDLFALEEELSRTIAATVTGKIESDLQRIALAKAATDQKSYDLLLSGTHYLQKYNGPDIAIAIDKLNQCLALDPDNVRAHAGLYYCHAMNWMERWVEDYQPSFELAGQHARAALSLGPEIGIAQVAYAEYLLFSREYEKAAVHLEKALAINPNDIEAIATKAINLEMQGKFALALEQAQTGYRLDPHHPWNDWNLAENLFYAERYEDAMQTIAISPNPPGFIRLYNVAANIKLGRIEQARHALQVFLQAARIDMLAMPKTLDEWLCYTMDNFPFEDSRVNQALIGYLVEAGLEDELVNFNPTGESTAQPTILVLPFNNLSGDPEQEYFSDGITESIINNLSSFSGLNVKSRHTSFAFRNSSKGIDEIGKDLGVQYIVEGSIRKFSDKVRIMVQLDESASGNQLWGKRFDDDLEDLISLEDEMVQTIAGTISGRIGRDIKLTSRLKPAKDLQSYDYLMRGWYHIEKFTPEDMSAGIDLLEKCIEIDPENAEAHASLAGAIHAELYENWTPDCELAKSRARGYIKKAIEIDPGNALAQAFMSENCLMRKEFEKGLFHANKSIELNSALPDGYSMKAYFLSLTGKHDEAVRFAEISMQIDPYHRYMGWITGEVYRAAGTYDKAIEAFRSMPSIPNSVQADIAACLAGLGQIAEARVEIAEYHRLARAQMPNYPRTHGEWRSLWHEYSSFQFDEDFETYFDLLLKAGLCDDLNDSQGDTPSIAVLPFENMSGDPEQEFFSDGITTDIISTLSKFNHLRIVARHSILQYKNQKAAISEIAEQQGVRYILEGSVRKSGNRIRVTAELIDSHSEQNCWSERYDRDLDDLFAVQDEITRNITLAMKVHLDDGDMALHRSAGASNLKAWQLTLEAIDLQDTYIRENILEARFMANEAIRLDPGYPYAWIVLGWTYWQEAYSGWCENFELPLAEAEKANLQARNLNPEYAEAWSQAGLIHLMKHESDKAQVACRKAVELEPGNAEIQALRAFSLIFIGEHDQARLHNHNMLKLCPVLPNWYYLIGGQIEQYSGNLDEAIQFYQQAIDVEPDSPLCRFYLVDGLMERGDETRARIIADEIRELDETVTGKGLVRAISKSRSIRDRFQANLAKFDLL